MSLNKGTQRVQWVDLAKFLAICAVIVDHTCMVLYENQGVQLLTYYSVSMFILMMGITSFWTLERVEENRFDRYIIHKCWGIFRPYIIATFIYFVVIFKSFDLEVFWNYILHFNISGPFYYVFLYIQLVLISPVLFKILSKLKKYKWGRIGEFGVGILLLAFASWANNNTNMLGCGVLFGGTYIVLLYVGMCFAKHYFEIQSNVVTIVLFIMDLAGDQL